MAGEVIELCWRYGVEDLIRCHRKQAHKDLAKHWLEDGVVAYAKHHFMANALAYFDKIRKDERLWR